MAKDTRTYRFTLTVDVEPGHPAYDDPEWEPTEVLVQREQARARGTREQVAGNVTMGTERAMKEGRWCNRPPTGYRLEDGLLIIRYLFGFRGATLIGGAVAADCTRCSATAIESYLASLMP